MKSNAKLKVTQKEVEKSIEITIPNEEANDVTAGIIKNNHLRGLFSDYSVINQEFFNYVISCNLTGRQSKILFFILASVDLENRVILNNEVISKVLNINPTNVSREVNFLTEKKIILKKKARNHTYQLSINYDMVNPNFIFKNKATKENIKQHKALMEQEKPYIKQENLFGEIDMLNPNTGEVFYTYPQEQAHKHLIGTQKAPKQIEPKNEVLEIEYQDVTNPIDEIKLEEEKIYKLKTESLNRLEVLKEKSLNWEMDNFYIDDTGTPACKGINPYENQIKKIEHFLEKIDF